ncbi:MAG: biotin--[acetyl-CoA-carboxylase] ligase [Bacteroidota bacterium]
MKIRFVNKCESTNRLLMQSLNDYADDELPFALWTDNQTAGRGQRGRIWECPPGEALAASFLYAHRDFPVEQIYTLNKWVSLAVCELLDSYLPTEQLRIKWPNDLLIDGRKICGILIENLLSGRQVARSVIGIGLNVNQKGFDGDYQRQPTSLRFEMGQHYDLQQLMRHLADVLHRTYQRLLDDPEAIEQAYRQRLFLRDEPCEFRLTHTALHGRIRDVDAQGRLMVESQGTVQYFSHGEIAFPR